MSEEIRNRLFVEKYKPKTIDDVLLEPHLKSKFKEFIDSGNVETIMLSGTPGNSKTTCAKLIAEGITDDWIFINASEDTSVDVVRNKIERFCITESLAGDIKVVILDEFDGASITFQQALKQNIEKFYGTTRFIFTTNNPQNVDPAIRSRCQEFTFGNIDKKEIYKRLVSILKEEEIEFDKDNLVNILKSIGTDVRKLLMELQRLTLEKDGKKVLQPLTSTDEKFITIMSYIKEKDVTKVRKYITEEGVNHGPLLKYMLNNAKQFGDEWPSIMMDISDIAYRMKVGVDPDIAFSAGIVSIMEKLDA